MIVEKYENNKFKYIGTFGDYDEVILFIEKEYNISYSNWKGLNSLNTVEDWLDGLEIKITKISE